MNESRAATGQRHEQERTRIELQIEKSADQNTAAATRNKTIKTKLHHRRKVNHRRDNAPKNHPNRSGF
jgi:hypothetical protein